MHSGAGYNLLFADIDDLVMGNRRSLPAKEVWPGNRSDFESIHPISSKSVVGK